jgi:tellurite resistance protein TerC
MIVIWVAFIAFVLAMLALDLGVFHRKAHVVSMREALAWSGVWVSLGLLFSVFVYFAYENHWYGIGGQIDRVDGMINDGRLATIKYLTGYVIEKSLSVDNIFVIAMIFTFFAVPAKYQHRVLFWGILGALVMRGAMIGIGTELIKRYHWILYIFGGFLILTALKMLLMKEGQSNIGESMAIRLVRRWLPVTRHYHGQHFIVRVPEGEDPQEVAEMGQAVSPPVIPSVPAAPPRKMIWMLTPLALALVVVETTDLIFAVDSIPAIFAITTDPFLVFTSNVFAILGLRAMYFALAGLMDKFRFLKVSLAVVLALVGVKMLTADWLREAFPAIKQGLNLYVLAMVFIVLGTGVAASLWLPRREEEQVPERV